MHRQVGKTGEREPLTTAWRSRAPQPALRWRVGRTRRCRHAPTPPSRSCRGRTRRRTDLPRPGRAARFLPPTPRTDEIALEERHAAETHERPGPEHRLVASRPPTTRAPCTPVLRGSSLASPRTRTAPRPIPDSAGRVPAQRGTTRTPAAGCRVPAATDSATRLAPLSTARARRVEPAREKRQMAVPQSFGLG